MAEVVLYAVAARRGEHDREEAAFLLAPIKSSREVDAYRDQIEQNWIEFLDDLERRLTAVTQARPSVTTADVVAIRDAIYAVVEESIDRVAKRVENDPGLADRVRQEAAATFQFPAALKPAFRSQFHDELKQILRFGVFVFAQKLVLYRVLEEAGPRRRAPFRLDRLEVPHTSSDPRAICALLSATRSGTSGGYGIRSMRISPSAAVPCSRSSSACSIRSSGRRVSRDWHSKTST
jgi:hypothetical protein